MRCMQDASECPTRLVEQAALPNCSLLILADTTMLDAANLQTTVMLTAAGGMPQGARPTQPGLPQLPPNLLGQLQQVSSGQQPALQQFLAMQMARQQVSWTELFATRHW